jgi:hypothetical protein
VAEREKVLYLDLRGILAWFSYTVA